MKLYELIKSNHWLSIELTLLKLYPEQEEFLDDYRIVFEKLQSTSVKEQHLEIVFTECFDYTDDENEGEHYIDVSGQKKTEDSAASSISYALEFKEWNKWLGMDIASSTIENFSELEIIAHCLNEMNFIGFDEEEIQEELKLLNGTIETYQQMSEEEKKKNTNSLENFLKELDDLDEEE